MGKLRSPVPVKFIMAITWSPLAEFGDVEEQLVKSFGEIALRSSVKSFSETSYYEKEMGKNLKKVYISFQKLINAEEIVDIKLQTNLLERHWCSGGNRRVNLDPGYLEKAKLILVTTKNYSHRIYLGSGIYGDVQLRMIGGGFRPLEWTYPDYRKEEVIQFFKKVRDHYCREVDQWQRKNRD